MHRIPMKYETLFLQRKRLLLWRELPRGLFTELGNLRRGQNLQRASTYAALTPCLQGGERTGLLGQQQIYMGDIQHVARWHVFIHCTKIIVTNKDKSPHRLDL